MEKIKRVRGKGKQLKNWCGECCMLFASKYLFQKHNIAAHNKKSAYTCEFCCKEFIKKSHWKEHVTAVHVNTRDCVCTICNHTYKTPRSLRRHQKTVHMRTKTQDKNEETNASMPVLMTNKGLTCSDCQEEFPSRVLLSQHNADKHMKSYTHLCDTCGKSFLSKSHLREHSTVHCDTRDFHCTLCDLTYKSARGLKSHAKENHRVVCTETRDENNEMSVSMTVVKIKKGSLTCSECLEDFSSRAELLQHNAEQHIESYKHLCDTCGKRFLRKTHLKDHVASVHIYGAKINCQLCGQSYKALSSLRRHMRDSHAGRKKELSVFDLLRNSGVMGTWHLREDTSRMDDSMAVDSLEVDVSSSEEDSESDQDSDEEDIKDSDVSLREEDNTSEQEGEEDFKDNVNYFETEGAESDQESGEDIVDNDVSLPEEDAQSDQESGEEDFENNVNHSGKEDVKSDKESGEEDVDEEEGESDMDSELDAADRYVEENCLSVDALDDQISISEEGDTSYEDIAIVNVPHDEVKRNDEDTISDAGIRLVDNHTIEDNFSEDPITGETLEEASTKMSLSVEVSNSLQQETSLSKDSGDDKNEEDIETSSTPYTCRWEPLRF